MCIDKQCDTLGSFRVQPKFKLYCSQKSANLNLLVMGPAIDPSTIMWQYTNSTAAQAAGMCGFHGQGRVGRVIGPRVGSVPGLVLIYDISKGRQLFSKLQSYRIGGKLVMIGVLGHAESKSRIQFILQDSLFMEWFST